MRSPDIGSYVQVLEKPREKALRDDRIWTVWSQSPTGWHLFIRHDDGPTEWDDQPARLLTPARKAVRA